MFLEDDLDIAQSDVELATQTFMDVLPDYGKKLRPMTVWFENDLAGDCKGTPHVAGCTVGTGHLFVLWLNGFSDNAYFHELLHGTGYRMLGFPDPAHKVLPWDKIAEMQTEYILRAPAP